MPKYSLVAEKGQCLRLCELAYIVRDTLVANFGGLVMFVFKNRQAALNTDRAALPLSNACGTCVDYKGGAGLCDIHRCLADSIDRPQCKDVSPSHSLACRHTNYNVPVGTQWICLAKDVN